MDKYEYNLKLDQMKSLCAEERYEEAAELADTINWNKVKNVNALVKVGEVFEKAERYQESRDVLLMAYDRSPIGRMIIYRLAEVAIKMKDFTSAQEYYDEFVKIAPHDNLRYVLKYNMQKTQGASFTELIAILEEFKEQEYIEEWAYELAYLYHKSGMTDKCIDACDELILWFGDGPYVERALELKMIYQPLTKSQEEKYRKFRQEKDGFLHIGPAEMERGGEVIRESVVIPPVEVNTSKFNTVNLQEEIVKGMQQIMDATEKATVSDTMDSIKKIVGEIPYLQIPKEPQDLVELEHIETDEEIDGSLKINFQEMLEEESDGQISLVTSDKMALERQITGQLTIQDVLEEWERTKRVAEAALYDAEQRKLESAKARALQEAGDIMDRLNTVIPKLDAGVTPKELLEEEYMHRGVEETPATSGEPIKEEASTANEEQPEYEEESEYVEPSGYEENFGETEPERISEEIPPVVAPVVFPKIEPIRLEKAPQILRNDAVAPVEIPIGAVPSNLESEIDQAEEIELEEIAESEEPSSVEEPVSVDSELELELPKLDEAVESQISELEQPAEMAEPELTEIEQVVEAAEAEQLGFEQAEEIAEPEQLGFEQAEEMAVKPEISEPEEMVNSELSEFNGVTESELSEFDQIEKEAPESDKLIEPEVSQAEMVNTKEKKGKIENTRKMSSWKEMEKEWFMRQKTSSIPEVPLPEDLDLFEDDPEKMVYDSLTEKQKSIFSYFVPVKGMEDQLCKALTGMTNHIRRREAATCGNLVIQGEQGCGKTVLATSILKVLQDETGFLNGKVGKIDASSLNQKDVKDVVEKVKGGCLIIEKAGDLNQATVYSLALAMEKDTNSTVYILEDTSKGIRKVLAREQRFTEKFTEKISVPIFTNEELVVFARSYSNELGYKIDEMAELALHNRISNIQRLDQATTLTEVKEIIDEAIDKEAHGGLKKAISILTAKRYTEDDKIVLTERNFE